MNPWQLAQQIKHELAQVAWPTGSREVVFGPLSVLVYAGAPPTEEEHPPGFPFALVTIDGGTPDADHPDLIEQGFSIAIAAEASGDPLGEHAVIGGARADYGKSAGAGLAEVAERARFAIQSLTSYDGASLIVSASGVGSPGVIGRGRQVAFEEFAVQALCTSAPYYAAPEQFKLTGDTWTWEADWITPRFDFKQFRVGYVTTNTPAESADDLEGVIYTGTDTEAAVTPVAGRFYHVFADYDSHGGTGVARSSDPVVGSYVAL